MTSNPFFDKMNVKTAGRTVLASIAPPTTTTTSSPAHAVPDPDPVAVAVPASTTEVPPPSSNDAPEVVPTNPISCVLRCIPTQPKAGKTVVCAPQYAEGTGEVIRMGIKLSLNDEVPCAFYQHNKRPNMGVTLMFALDDKHEVQNVSYNVKIPEKKQQIKKAETALREAFRLHGAEPDLTFVSLLKYANLYDDKPGAEFLDINYQTIERVMNPLLSASSSSSAKMPIASTPKTSSARKRTPVVEYDPGSEEGASDDEDVDLVSGAERRRHNLATLDEYAVAVAEDLGLNEDDPSAAGVHPLPDEDENEHIAVTAAFPVEPLPLPSLPSPTTPVSKKSKTTKRVTPPSNSIPEGEVEQPVLKKARVASGNEDAVFVRAEVFAALKRLGTRALEGRPLWDVLQDKMGFLLSKQEDADFQMACLYATLQGTNVASDRDLWDLTGRILA